MDKQDEREEREYEVKKHEPEWRFLCSGIASLVLSVIAGVVLRIRSIHVIAVILICMVVVGLCISFLRRNKELTKLKKRIVCFVMGLCVLIIIVLMFLFNGLHVHKWNPTLIKDATCIL